MYHVLLVRFRGSEEVYKTSHHHLLLLEVVRIGRFGRLVSLVLHQWGQQLEQSIRLRDRE